MKRITSILLTLAMIFTLMPMNIFAVDEPAFKDITGSEYYAESAEILSELGILAGYEDGTYGAEKTITRAEMAAIVCRILGKEADAKEAKGKTQFDDVAADHWASGYINIATKEGIINGDGNGKFRPEDDVKYEEAIKMLVCALGYAENITVDPKDWSKAYLDIAEEKGFTENLKGKKGESATRGDIAVMSLNGMESSEAFAERLGKVATPVASVKEGEYKATQKVKLTTTTEGATIYYTTDGKVPTVKSTKYTKEISISKTTTLKAIAVKDEIVSDVMSVTYTIKKTSGGGGGGGGSSTPSTPSSYTVSFDLNYEGATGAPTTQTVNSGATATMPENPTRENHEFVGWYTNLEYTTKYDFLTTVSSNTTLYARWVDINDTTDTDGDGLTDPVEEYYGTDKTKIDTDGDSLTDYFEIKSSNTDPLLLDTDENGTDDNNEDFDEDGLTNIQEQENNCNPFSDDTDLDGLTDFDEINTHHTKPDIEDTDEDGLPDGDEIALGLNPLVQKTDGTTLDSERTFAQTLSEDSISESLMSADNAAVPSLNSVSSGLIDSNTSITSANNDVLTSNKAVVGEAVSVNTTSDMSDGQTSISFNLNNAASPISLMSLEEENSQYLICKYSDNDEDTEFVPLNTTYENGTLSATIDGEGTYFVLDTETFLTNLGVDVLSYFEEPEPMALMSFALEEEESVIIPHESKIERKRNANKKQDNTVMMLSSIEELEEELTLMSASTLGTRAQADIVFVIDTTGSMYGAINNVATNVNTFADDLVNKYNINANFSVIEFQDITHDGLDSTIQHKNGSSSWWNARSVNSFKNEINSLIPDDGGDWAETPIDGLAMARNLVSSSSTQKFFVLITDAPYKEDNQYGIANMSEMINLLVADGINVSVITDDWDDWTEFEYDVVGYYIIEDEYDRWRADVYYDTDNDKYFYLVGDYDYETGKETSTQVYIDSAKVVFEVYVGYIETDDDGYYGWYDVYKRGTGASAEYFYYKWTYDEETETETQTEVLITDVSEIMFNTTDEEKVSGYKDLYEKTSGLFGNIYDSSFYTVLNQIASMIDVNVNDGSWVVLNDYTVIKLDAEPSAGKDSDGDGLKDNEELINPHTTSLRKYIEALLKSRHLTWDEYESHGGASTITVWEYSSRPDKKDTDGDGIEDAQDPAPKKFTVTDRHLAIFAKLSYKDKDISKIDEKSFKNETLNYAKISEVFGWSKVDSHIERNSEAEIEGFAVNTYKNSKTNDIVVAFRGTDDESFFGGKDWGGNIKSILPWTSHPQAPNAEKYIKKIAEKYKDSNIYITGHSLGGYLAIYATAVLASNDMSYRIKRVVDFNALGIDSLTTSKKLKNGLKSVSSKIYDYRVDNDAVSIIGAFYGDHKYKYDINKDVAKKYGVDDKKWYEIWDTFDAIMACHDMINFLTYPSMAERY